MSAIGDAFNGLKRVLLMQENIERLDKNLESMATDLRRTRDYAASIDQRLARLEGMIDGFGMAAAAQARLPRDDEGR